MNEVKLIDANALKEELKRYFTNGVALYQILTIIDNAPTVAQNWRFYYDHGYKQAERDLKRPQDDLIKAFELLKAHCKNRECNKECVFYRELRVGDNIEQFCGLCEIVMSDERGEEK